MPLWTWTDLVNRIGFHGCELLIVDAEGFDVEILQLSSVNAQCIWKGKNCQVETFEVDLEILDILSLRSVSFEIACWFCPGETGRCSKSR